MNIYSVLIPVILITLYLFDLLVESLNVKSAAAGLPTEFEGYYDAEKYARSQRYLKDNTRFSLVSAGTELFVLLTFIYSGFFGAADMFVRSFGFGQIASGLVFGSMVWLVNFIVGLPFSVYYTFSLEAGYGFNRTTPRTFITDRLKGIALTALLGLPLGAAALWFFEHFGPSGWIYVWGAIAVFEIAVMYIAPVFIMPLFNKFEPLEEGELRFSIEKCAEKLDFKISGIFRIDGSKRSTKANAFFTGFGKNRRIALYDTLIELLSVSEITSVLAHEIGHYKKKHMLKGIILSLASTALMLAIFSLFIGNGALLAAFGFQKMSIYGAMLAFSALYAPLSRLIAVVGNCVSRLHEYEADEFSLKCAEPEVMAAALKKLSSENLSNLTPHPLKVFMEYSHPPVLARIRALARAKQPAA